MRINGHFSTFGQILNPKFEILMVKFLLTTKFGSACSKMCLERKATFLMQNFKNLGAREGVLILVETPKRHILARKYAFW